MLRLQCAQKDSRGRVRCIRTESTKREIGERRLRRAVSTVGLSDLPPPLHLEITRTTDFVHTVDVLGVDKRQKCPANRSSVGARAEITPVTRQEAAGKPRLIVGDHPPSRHQRLEARERDLTASGWTLLRTGDQDGLARGGGGVFGAGRTGGKKRFFQPRSGPGAVPTCQFTPVGSLRASVAHHEWPAGRPPRLSAAAGVTVHSALCSFHDGHGCMRTWMGAPVPPNRIRRTEGKKKKRGRPGMVWERTPSASAGTYITNLTNMRIERRAVVTAAMRRAALSKHAGVLTRPPTGHCPVRRCCCCGCGCGCGCGCAAGSLSGLASHLTFLGGRLDFDSLTRWHSMWW